MKIQVFKITSFLLLLGFVWFCESFCGNTRRKFIPWKKKNLNAEIRTHTICFFSFSSNNKYWYVNLQIGGITAASTTKKKTKSRMLSTIVKHLHLYEWVSGILIQVCNCIWNSIYASHQFRKIKTNGNSLYTL